MNRNISLLAVVVVLAVALASTAEAQITFSRDWLAGSGKRSQSSRVTFSRDWLAGSGKRSGGPATASGISNEVALSSSIMDIRDVTELLVDYLTTQIEDTPARKMSFYQYLHAVDRA